MSILKNIMYIEDEPDIRDIAKIALENIGGFQVETCESGAKALSRLAHHRPELILLDVMMPGMDGPATLKAIRALPEGKNIPVIFMTAKVQSHEINRYIELGSIGVISKPFDAMLLPATVQQLWDKHYRNSNG